jgi:uncharacterized protein YndB with AHSA1/START domain
MSEQLRVTRDVDASPERIFAVLSDPGRHILFDGADMVRGLAEGGPITGVGDAFVMNMENQVLGNYQVRNEVCAYEQDRKLGWGPALHPKGGYADKIGDMDPGGHTYMWELAPNEDGGTTVTQTYDWSGVWDPGFKSLFPMLNEDVLAASIERIGKAAG